MGNNDNKRILSTKDYIQRLHKFYHKLYGRDPDIDWIHKNVAKKINISKERIVELVSQIEGELKPMAPDIEYLRKEKQLNLEKIKQSLSNVTKRITPNTFINIGYSFRILKLILLFIGSGAIYMSIHYSYEWLKDFLSPLRALLLSSIMIMFAVSSFELILIFKQKKKYFLIGVFLLLWSVVTIFSMASTVAGQYNSRIGVLNKKYEQTREVDKQSKQQKLQEDQIRDYNDRLTALRKNETRLQGSLSKFTNRMIKEDIWMYNKLEKEKRINDYKIKQIEKELKSLRHKQSLEETIKKSPPDFYLWIGGLWDWNPEMIQFWMSIFPAIFIDLVAPISIAIFMFVKE